MRVRVSDPALLRDLISFLRSAGCVAEQASRDSADVFVPDARGESQARRRVTEQLGAWRSRHRGSGADIVD
jgi:hypothetical protein